MQCLHLFPRRINPARGFSWGRRMRLRLHCVNPVAADVSPLIIPAGEKFEPTHVGCYDEIDERPARQGIRFPAGANVAPTFGHVAQAWAKYQCPSHARIFNGTADDAPVPWVCVRSALCSVQQHRPSFHFVFAKPTGSSALRLKRGKF